MKSHKLNHYNIPPPLSCFLSTKTYILLSEIPCPLTIRLQRHLWKTILAHNLEEKIGNRDSDLTCGTVIISLIFSSMEP